jgi:hypothetical protein
MAYKISMTIHKSDDNPWLFANGSPISIAPGLPEQAAMIADQWWVAYTDFIGNHPVKTEWQAPDLHSGTGSFTFETMADMQSLMVKYYTAGGNQPFYNGIFSLTDAYYTITDKISSPTVEV